MDEFVAAVALHRGEMESGGGGAGEGGCRGDGARDNDGGGGDERGQGSSKTGRTKRGHASRRDVAATRQATDPTEPASLPNAALDEPSLRALFHDADKNGVAST